jgi:hypothetical protein
VVIGVSPDDAASHTKFVTKYQLPFILLSDPDRSMMTTYGAYGEKMMYGRKTMGVIRSTVWIDPTGKVKKHWARVAKAETHPEAVLAACFDVAIRAPSSHNLEIWRFLDVRTPETRAALDHLCLDQPQARQAANLIVAVA